MENATVRSNSISRAGKCPFCDAAVPLRIVRVHGSFDCPCCGQALKVHRIHKLVIQLAAVALGFLLASEAGAEGLFLFFFGLMISPLVVVPVWIASFALIRPILVPSTPTVTTLNLK
jgi:hypothetical protein